LATASGIPPRHCASDEIRYEIIPLGNLEGAATGLNNRGQVVGSASFDENEAPGSFTWDCATGVSRFVVGGISAINDRGQILAGSSDPDTGVSRTFLWDRVNGTRLLGEGFPLSLNNRGDVTFNTMNGPVLWTRANGSVQLDSVSGAFWREAFVNDLRQVGGYAGTTSEPFSVGYSIWSQRHGLRIIAGDPDGAFRSFSYDFNERGDILGNVFFAQAGVPFIVSTDGTYRLLVDPVDDQFMEANAFNNRRQVVGFYFSAGSEDYDAFLWDPQHGRRDLNELAFGRVPGSDEPAISWANDINDWGWIAGTMRVTPDQYRPALIVPVPANESFYRNLARLQGPRLCHALSSLKLRAVISELICGR
jgi:hypothetical protein